MKKWWIKEDKTTTGKLTWILTWNNISFMNCNNMPLGTDSDIMISFGRLYIETGIFLKWSRKIEWDGSINIYVYILLKSIIKIIQGK